MDIRLSKWITVAALLGALAFSREAAATAPTLPVIPAPVFLVTNYGAVGNGTTLNTTALQNTINACLQAGGGTVEVPSGTFLTGPLVLGSNLNLQLDAGATILFSNDAGKYPLSGTNYQNCLTAKNCHDIAITGTGTIDGQGATWWANFNSGADTNHRPYMVQISNCTRLLVQGITLQNSPSFHLVPDACQEVTIQNIKILAPSTAPNTDGIDPSGWDYLIQNCTIDVGDDNIAVKPNHLITAGQPSCLNFLVQNCTFLHGHGMSIGGQTPGGMNGMTVQNCTFNGTVSGIRMKAARGAGGLVQNLLYNNITMTNVGTPILITSYYPSIPTDLSADPAQAVTSTTPIWQNISINNVTATGASTDMKIIGLPEMPVSNITLTNVSLSGKYGVTVAHGRGIQFSNVHYTNTSGAALTQLDAQITTVNAATVSGTVSAQGWTGATKTVTFTLTPTGSTLGIPFPQAFTPGSGGAFTLSNVPAGTYTLAVKADRCLQKDLIINTTSANVSGLVVTLTGGDVNGDGVINGADVSAASAAFRSRTGDANWNASADVNGDGVINGADISLISANFRKRSDP